MNSRKISLAAALMASAAMSPLFALCYVLDRDVRRSEAQATALGAGAAKIGLSHSDNPFPEGYEANAWLNGWTGQKLSQ